MPFNGPPRELSQSESMTDEAVYCVQCGTIYIFDAGRHCPNCTLNDRIDDLEAELADAVDGGEE